MANGTLPTSANGAGRPPIGIGWRHRHYGELLEQLPDLDFIEVHSENFFAQGGAALSVLHQGRAHYPVSLHGVGLSLGSAMGLDPWHLKQLGRLVATTDPVRISDHASFARGQVSGVALHGADLLPVPFTQEALDVMCSNVQQAQDFLRRPIAVENLSAYVQWPAADMNEPAFLNRLAERTGCQLLIDVNNIYVNALNAQLRDEAHDTMSACQEWLGAICPRHVAELHVAGHVHCGDIVIDDHGSAVSHHVWALYGQALKCFGPVPTLVEWDTDVPKFSDLLAQAALARAHAKAAFASAPSPGEVA